MKACRAMYEPAIHPCIAWYTDPQDRTGHTNRTEATSTKSDDRVVSSPRFLIAVKSTFLLRSLLNTAAAAMMMIMIKMIVIVTMMRIIMIVTMMMISKAYSTQTWQTWQVE